MNSVISKIKPILPSYLLRKTGWTVFLILFFPVIATSCFENAGVEYSHFAEIGESGIPEDWEYEFSPVPADSASFGKVPFDLILVVRYSSSTRSKDVILNIEDFSFEQEHPDTTELTIPLFNKDNEPLGKGNFAIYEIADTLRRGITIPQGFTISVSSPLPQEETAGIRSIGIVLSRTGSSRKLKLFDL